ncbi:MAG: hypothetical protein HZB42_13375 [Sphingobacteriales bacterium]|nr:hypothetical protein [Sphingobacteriales bacterium]
MKIASLLAQFLYTNKQLYLPGIGSFIIDSSAIPDPENTKSGKNIPSEAIQFENNPSVKESAGLVQYISSETGKIKALAAADLDSHLSLMQQFLNIGKPFLLEGIGSLVKTKSGEFVFTPGETLSEKMQDYSSKESSVTPATEESLADYKSIFYKTGKKNINLRKPMLILFIVAGLALAVWGGYKVYKMTTGNNKSANNEKKNEDKESTLNDSVTNINTSPQDTSVSVIPSGTYKFILEIANSKRAFERFGKLKAYWWNVQMETKDSVSYKLFLLLPSTVADTSRILDSLSMLNGRRVYIEQ